MQHLFSLVSKKDIAYKMVPVSGLILLLVFGENLIFPIFSIFVNSITNNLFYTGILISLLGFVGIIISIPMGIIVDKYNIKNILLFALSSYIFVPILYVSFQNIIALFIIRIISALMSTLLWCAIWTYVYSKVDCDHRAHEISVVSKAMRFGSSVSPLIGGLFAVIAFILPFYISSLVGLLGFFIVLVAINDTEPKKIDSFGYLFKKDMKIVRDLFMRYKFIILLSIIAYAVMVSVSSFLPILLEQHGFGFLAIGTIITLSLTPIFLFELNIGDFIDRIGNTQAMILSLIIMGFTTIVLSITFNIFVLIPIIIVFGIGNTIVFIAFTSQLSEWSNPEDRGLMSGIRKTIMSLGSAAGPLMSGFFLKVGGTKVTMALIAAASLVTVLIYVFKKEKLFNQQAVLK